MPIGYEVLAASSRPTGFRSWYRRRFGHVPTLVQGFVWLVYGFLWIPIAYVLTKDPTSPFGRWYRNRFGGIINLPLPICVLVHVLLWLFYGFAWIPILYWATGPDAQAEEQAGLALDGTVAEAPAGAHARPAATRSAWYLWAYMPYLNALAWLHAGLRTRYPLYFVFAVLYSIPFAIFIVYENVEPPDWVMAFVVVSWLAGIVHVHWQNLEVNLRIKHAATHDGETEEALDRRIAAEYAARRAAMARAVAAGPQRTQGPSDPVVSSAQSGTAGTEARGEDADKAWSEILRYYLNKPPDYWVKRAVLAAVFSVGAWILNHFISVVMDRVFH